MTYVQATTGSGGWPMSVWLTPDLEPFVGGTYFPPDNRYGRLGLSSGSGTHRKCVEKSNAAENSGIGKRRRDGTAAAAGGAIEDSDLIESTPAFRIRHSTFGGVPTMPSWAVSAAHPSSRGHPSTTSFCAIGSEPAKRKRSRWWWKRCSPWRRAACTTNWGAVSIAIQWTRRGSCRISKRCSTTRRSWRLPIWMPSRSRATRHWRARRGGFSITCCAT